MSNVNISVNGFKNITVKDIMGWLTTVSSYSDDPVIPFISVSGGKERITGATYLDGEIIFSCVPEEEMVEEQESYSKLHHRSSDTCCGKQRPGTLEMIACAVDNQLDGFSKIDDKTIAPLHH